MIIDQVLTIATAVITNDKGEVLFLERGETKTFQKHWQFPEGKLEKKEKPIDALKRELKEELNSVIETITFESISHSILEAKDTRYLAIRIIFSVKLKSAKITLSSEHSDYKWINQSEINNFTLLPGTIDVLESINLT